jgi:transposase
VPALIALVRDEKDGRLPAAARMALREAADTVEAMAERVETLEREIVARVREDDDMRRLTTIPGVGPIAAASVRVLVPDPGGLSPARHFAAWLGLTPRA